MAVGVQEEIGRFDVSVEQVCEGEEGTEGGRDRERDEEMRWRWTVKGAVMGGQ